MDEKKIKKSFQNIKEDIDNIKLSISEILIKLQSKKKFELEDSSENNFGKFFTSKVLVNEEMREAVNNVFNSGIFTSGEKVKEFEMKFSKHYGVKHAISVINGTIAIELVLKSLGIGKNDEVIVPSHTAIPTVEPVLHVGAKPVFVDILEDNYNINPLEVEKAITKKTKAVILVHLYGNPANLYELIKICEKRKIFLIEDCAQANGSRYNNSHVGTFGIAGCFSFYPTKNMTVCGEGGMIITNDDEVAKKAKMMSNHGEDGKFNHVILGNNYRLAEIPSAIGIKQLEMLESFIDRRREIAKIYDEEFKNNEKIILPKETENYKHSYHLYVIRVKKEIRDELIDRLKKENIFLGIHYPVPVHKQPIIKKLINSPKLKITEKIVKEIISLPIYPSLKNDDVKMIARKINNLVNIL
tara:strand:+ start:34918 stop:36156 length:1239 start_codon:yes stop_codon:yes gene_type:complete